MTNTFEEALIYYFDHPLEFVEDIIGVKPNNHQREILLAIGEGHKHISVKSGHGIGKTALESWVIIWFMTTRPHCRIPCTAPTQHQLFDVLWSEIKKWINRIKDERIKNLFEWTKTHLYNKHNPETWFATARSASKAENLQGFHADELMFIIDEASGVDQEIMEVIQGALTNEGAICLMFGNPTQLSGTFFDSHNKERKHWKTFTFSCIDNSMVSEEYVTRMKEKYGEDSSIYKVRVLGDFPDEADDTIIPLSWCEQAAINDFEDSKKGPIIIGVDVARFGNDKTVIMIRSDNKILKMNIHFKRSTMETAGYIMQAVNEYKEDREVYVYVDEGGVGGGVVDRIDELNQSPNVFTEGINNGARANDERYVNLGAELWWLVREQIRDLDMPNDDELIAQLSTRKFKMTSTGKIQLESKDDMKKRGLDSPDKADALALCLIDERESTGTTVW